MTMVATAIGTTAVGLGGAYMQSQATKDAASQQAGQAASLSRRQAALNAPYMYAGNAALNPLLALYGINGGLQTYKGEVTGGVSAATPEQQAAAMQQFYSSPEYTIQKGALDQAQQRQAAAQGTAYSPSAALGSAEIAGKTFGDWRNNLASLGNMGPQGAGIQSANLQSYYGSLGNAAGATGQANANLYGAAAQTGMDALGQYNQYSQYQNRTNDLLSQLKGMSGGGGGGNYGIQAGTMPGFQRFDTGGYNF